MNYDPRYSAVCGDARLPPRKIGQPVQKRPRVHTREVPMHSDAPAVPAPDPLSSRDSPVADVSNGLAGV